MIYTATYTERKNFVKFDDSHVLLYLNEQPGEVTNPETGESVPGYSYTGDQADGSTMIAAEGVTDDNCRDKFVAGLIGLHYDLDAQIATLANGADTPEHAAELTQFATLRKQCKGEVDELLARTL